ncbi:MAG: hypothetical protein E7174_03945 [Firmicutes bacterium]|nr:hypothetical protein [Bacillota bacterium]
MSSEIIAKAITSIAFGITGAIFITPIFIFLRKIIYGPTINKKLLEKVKEKGNVVVAKLVKHYDQYNHSGAYKNVSGKEIGIYEYEVNGRKYKYRFITINGLQEELTLYYLKNPRKASVAKELFITQRSPWMLSFLIIGFISWFIAFICLINMNI